MSEIQDGEPAEDLSTEDGQKRKFAIALLKDPENAFKCALAVFGDDTGKALKLSSIWPSDLAVLDFQQEYIQVHGPDSVLPSRDKLARSIYNMAEAETDPDVRLKAYKLYGEIRGYIEKPGTSITTNVQNNTVNKVMKVKDHGTEEDWEKKFALQQTKLVSDSE